MKFQSIKIPRVSDFIVSQIEEMILDGALKPGDRLPAERDLSQQLDVSRPSLREALVILEAKGLIRSRRGGGTFVSDAIASSITDPIMALLEKRPETAFDILELRLALEETTAQLAAFRANETDRKILRRRFEALESTYDQPDRSANAEADVAFHVAIADASHNVALVHVMRSLFTILHTTILDNLNRIYKTPEGQDLIRDHHRHIFDAVISGDADAARVAARTHLQYVNEALKSGLDENGEGRAPGES